RCIYKPFYYVSAAAVINNDHTEGMFNDRRKAARAFTAPGARILIVDDNPVNLKVAAGLMKPYQMNITTVDSGQKALDTIKDRHDFNIIFMDHMMPEMDGVECTAQIRKLPGEYFRTVPIIALTANTVNNSRQMFLSSGFDDFLAKPIDISMLDRLLRKYIPRELRNKTVQEESKADMPQTMAGDRRHNEAPQAPQQQEASTQVLFDPELGISYTAGDKELYLEILTEYARQGEEMRSILTQTFEEKDWKNYVIKVHALKSTSLNIGAKTLSELAKKLELSGKAGEYEPILSEHDTLMGMYADVLAQTLAYLKENGREITAAVQEEPSAQTEEISPEELVSLIDSFKEACDSFDGTLAGEIAGRAAGKSVKGVPIGEAFAAAGKMAEECDYDMAAEEAEKLRSLAGGA
ncbi:MAG: response regulator, partial [Oscillospiraceae bacterium]|nr:response regulator [Oscillospiraceae bacterium]